MDRKKILGITLCLNALFIIFFSSCNKTAFNDNLILVLDVENLTVEKSVSYRSQMSCIAEEYILSKQTTTEFLSKKDKIFPKSNFYTDWDKYGWCNSSTDTLSSYAKYYLDLYWQEDVAKLQLAMKNALNKEETYFAYYYSGIDDFISHIQLYVYDTSTSTIYIIDSGL